MAKIKNFREFIPQEGITENIEMFTTRRNKGKIEKKRYCHPKEGRNEKSINVSNFQIFQRKIVFFLFQFLLKEQITIFGNV